MKKLIMALFAILMTASVFANGDNPSKSSLQDLRNEITELIGSPQLTSDMEEARVTLHFTINTKNEIVVLSTNNQDFDGYIKGRLNYQQLERSSAVINKKYTLPLIIRKG